MVDNCEEILAKKFHDQLDRNGVEINPKETGILLHQLGLIYKNQSPDKLSLLKSAVLLNGAILRNIDNVEYVKFDLQELCKNVLILAKAENKDADFVKLSIKVKQKVKEMRAMAKIEIQESKILPEILENCGSDLKVKKDLLNCKINHIQKIQNQITSAFVEVLKKLASFTKETLGNPPCGYALVGLGSLTRNEITPYSDFEQLIILEEGIEQRDDYENVLEYFRWFAMIFLLTLINLGEMIIPFADIQSFQKFRPKFRDHVAKVGISPDGFSLSAGKNAICGSIELIKTPIQMAKFLSQEFLQNHFSDLISEKTAHFVNVLCKTKFITGDDNIHDQLSEELHRSFVENYEIHMKLLQATIDKEYLDFDIMQNLLKYVETDKIDVKRMVYRTSTLYIVAMGKRYKCKSASCFDIVSELKKMQILSEESEIKLKYVLALACEVRLKIYMVKKEQQDNIDDAGEGKIEKLKLIEAIGLQSAVDYFSITASLQESARIMIGGKEEFPILPEFRFFVAALLTDHITAISYIDRIYGSSFELSNTQPEMVDLFKRNKPLYNFMKTKNDMCLQSAQLISCKDFVLKMAKTKDFFPPVTKQVNKVEKATSGQSDRLSVPAQCEVLSDTHTIGNVIRVDKPPATDTNLVSKNVGNNLNISFLNEKPDEDNENESVPISETRNKKSEKEKIEENYRKRNKNVIKLLGNLNPTNLLESDLSSMIQGVWGDAKTENQERIKTSMTEMIKFIANGNNVLDKEQILLVKKIDALGMRAYIEQAFKDNTKSDSNKMSMRDILKLFNLPDIGYVDDIVQGLEKRKLHDVTLEEIVKVVGDECTQIGYRKGLKLLETFLEQGSNVVAELGVAYKNQGYVTPHSSKVELKGCKNNKSSQKESKDGNAHSAFDGLSVEDKSLFDDFMKSIIHFKDSENNQKNVEQGGYKESNRSKQEESNDLNNQAPSALDSFSAKDKYLFDDFMKSIIHFKDSKN